MLSSSNFSRSLAGLTLIELLVTLAILSILATVALPYVELSVRRDRELELRQSLREVREAIDSFHADWLAGRISRSTDSASEDGYPRRLQVMVDGVDTGRAGGGKRRYLRRIPRNPFAETASQEVQTQWLLRGYQDSPEAPAWNGRDVYDIRANTSARAIDASLYRDW